MSRAAQVVKVVTLTTATALVICVVVVFVWYPNIVMPTLPNGPLSYKYINWVYNGTDNHRVAFEARCYLHSISPEGAPMEGLWGKAARKGWSESDVIATATDHIKVTVSDPRLFSGAVMVLLTCKNVSVRREMAKVVCDNKGRYGPFHISIAKTILDNE